MAGSEQDLDPLWQDLDWAIGQMLLMGWDGTAVTPQIRSLIEDHHLGSIILTTKNLKSADETAKLVQELQTIAHNAGHPVPLLIALDQENGGVNSLFDEDYICQFPSAMGMAATGSLDMAYSVANATAKEISAVGVNLILGPVLDVLTDARFQPMGVRSSGDDPHEVSQYSIAAIKGYKHEALATCGKHFPTYGNFDFRGSTLDIPIITQTLQELSLSALVPYKSTIATGNLDAVFVGGCGIASANMNVPHACLSEQVVDELLRKDLGFHGVAISECLEMEALCQQFGVKEGTVMAVQAGCDLILLCRDFNVQQVGIEGMKLGIEDGIIDRERIMTSLRRVLRMKAKCTSWAKALNPPGISLLSQLHPRHLELSKQAYESSITVVRDEHRLLPLSESMEQREELLLLTPLVKPLPASSATKAIESRKHKSGKPNTHGKLQGVDRGAAMIGEGVFRELGRSITRARNGGKVLHTSYTANGVRPAHENLINQASGIIIVTADTNRNIYQSGFTKHVAMICAEHRAKGQKKSLTVVAVSSPYDFAMDKAIGTYICTFDFTETALQALVRALFGDFTPRGTLPGTLRKTKKVVKKTRQRWLVESYDSQKDAPGLRALMDTVARASAPNLDFLKITSPFSFEPPRGSDIVKAHFVVRNSSTKALYGFCATYHLHGAGSIGALLVDPTKRNLAIGRSLHARALKGLIKNPGIKTVQLGTCFPSVAFLGIPADDNSAFIKAWFASNGWDMQSTRRLTCFELPDAARWTTPEGLRQTIASAGIKFDLIDGRNVETVLRHVGAGGGQVVELYKLALKDHKACRVVRATDAAGTATLGTVVISSPKSALWQRVPCLYSASGASHHQTEEELVWGVVAPVIGVGPEQVLVLQGLVGVSLKESKAQGAARVVLSWVAEGEFGEAVLAMGLRVVLGFDAAMNATDRWSDLS